MGKKNTSHNKALSMVTLSDTSSIDNYVDFVNSIKILTEEQERKLAKLLRYQNDMKAAQTLIMSHLKFVVKIARGFSGYGLPITDLVQEGNIGLMKAVRRFDPSIGVRLVSFAVYWIKSEMHEYILKNWRIVKIATTKSQRKLFFNIRSNKKNLNWFSKNEMKHIAEKLNVKLKTVAEMEKRMHNYDTAFDTLELDDEKEKKSSPIMYLGDRNANPEIITENEEIKSIVETSFRQIIDNLDLRSKDIFISRWLSEKKTTLSELSYKYQISLERVRQIESSVIKRLKSAAKKLRYNP